MFCWHKWSKWSEVKTEEWEKQHIAYGVPAGVPTQYLRNYQERVCDKCGKYQKRYIEE